LTLSNGTSVRGCFFISGNSRTHSGPEGVKDVLNSEAGFFPFETRLPERMTTILYNREHVLNAVSYLARGEQLARIVALDEFDRRFDALDGV